LFVFFDLYRVYVCIFVIYIEFFPYCLFVSNSQVIGCEDCLRNDLYCVSGALNSTQSNPIIRSVLTQGYSTLETLCFCAV